MEIFSLTMYGVNAYITKESDIPIILDEIRDAGIDIFQNIEVEDDDDDEEERIRYKIRSNEIYIGDIKILKIYVNPGGGNYHGHGGYEINTFENEMNVIYNIVLKYTRGDGFINLGHFSCVYTEN